MSARLIATNNYHRIALQLYIGLFEVNNQSFRASKEFTNAHVMQSQPTVRHVGVTT